MRVLVADDHALFRYGIVTLLSARDIEVVAETGDGEETIRRTRELRPDLVLMDIKMPRLGGIEATRAIKAELPETKIVMLTAFDDDDNLFEAIKSGADGYMLKNLYADEFFELLARLARGEAPMSPSLAMRILRELARQGRTQNQADTDVELTGRELEVLRLVADGAANREIAARLDITENTVKYHLRRILDKLRLQNRAQVVAYALQRGLGGRT